MTKEFDEILKKHTQGLLWINVALIGDSTQGTAISAVNYTPIDTDTIASYANDLLKANQRLCHAFNSDTPIYFVGSSSKDNELIVRLVPDSEYFVVFVASTDEDTKMVVKCSREVAFACQKLLLTLKKYKDSARTLIDYAKNNAPDPVFVMLRLSLKMGVPLERLDNADLEASEVQVLQDSLKDIFGVDDLPVTL